MRDFKTRLSDDDRPRDTRMSYLENKNLFFSELLLK